MFHVKHQKRKGENERHKVEKRGNCRALRKIREKKEKKLKGNTAQ